MIENHNIIPYTRELSQNFRDLNLEWLEKYFYVEPHDKDLLERCEEMIIDKGGYIFFYQEEKKILGTFALIKIKNNVFELGKMAVTESDQGRGIGQKLLFFCLGFSKAKKWEKLVLYSNTKLKNSIFIYKKFGFKEVSLETENPYERGNIKMELML